MGGALRDTATLTFHVDSYVYCRNYKRTLDLLTSAYISHNEINIL